MKLEKICQHCGRPFEWRKKWEKDWENIKLCGEPCRRAKKPKIDRLIEDKILEMLHSKDPGKSLCPSDVARALFENEQKWRAEMERTRCAARRLAHDDKIIITQKGKAVDPGNFKGPIRLQIKN